MQHPGSGRSQEPQLSRYRGATAICPNRKELSAATGEPPADLERLLAAGQAMLPSLEMEFMAVTLGEKGIAVLRPDSRLHAPAVVRQVYDVSGAGDTVIAVFALAMACGVADRDCCAGGEHRSRNRGEQGRHCSRSGAMSCWARFSREIALPMDEKVLPLDRLLSRVAGWRSAGQRVVFTNGCFDILHIGHITLLEQARRTGDRLIVGLNSDNSVRACKGAASSDRRAIVSGRRFWRR